MNDPTCLCKTEMSPGKKRFAAVFSNLVQPPILDIPVLLLINMAADGGAGYAVSSSVSLLFATVLPIAVVLYFSKKTGNDDGDIVRREDRIFPLAVAGLIYLAGSVALIAADAPDVTVAMMVSCLVCTAAVIPITMHWKISLHAMGIMCAAVALTWTFGPVGLLSLSVYPVAMWCRYVLGKHTPMQMAGGTALGAVLTSAVFFLVA